MKTIDEHIQKDQEEFWPSLSTTTARCVTSPKSCNGCQITRSSSPTTRTIPLRWTFCEQNPDEPECLVYDD